MGPARLFESVKGFYSKRVCKLARVLEDHNQDYGKTNTLTEKIGVDVVVDKQRRLTKRILIRLRIIPNMEVLESKIQYHPGFSIKVV